MSASTIVKPLKQVFSDSNYAWELLEAEMKLETSESQSICGEDISYLLQLYMRGVQKMNSLLDIRESFFKNRVTTLMSRPTVIKILNKPMTKKAKPAVVNCSTPINQSKNSKQQTIIQSPTKMLDTKTQLQLKQKKQNLQMRLAYSAQENNTEALKKMMAQHSQKQTVITQKIDNIVNSHEERLRKRINERKLKTLTAKSRSEAFIEHPGQDVGDFEVNENDANFNGIVIKIENNIQPMEKNNQLNVQESEQLKHNNNEAQNKENNKSKARQSFSVKIRRRCRSLQPKFISVQNQVGYIEPDSPSRRKISVQISQLQRMKDVQQKSEQMKKYIQQKKKNKMVQYQQEKI